MIYLDSSVVLAHFLVEARRLPDRVWDQAPTSSRLLEYEVWTRLHAKGLGASLRTAVRNFFASVTLVDLTDDVLARAREPYPVQIRTLDALHLATIEYLRQNGELVELATYDARMVAVARALGVAIYEP
jgi:predicted nucleic acid-binding protein